jgi:hypothetical protein
MVVTGTPGDADWMELVEEAANKLLDFANSEEDVMSIYKKNKQLFEEVKAQDAVFFKDLMDKFSTARAKFKEAA